MPIKQMFRTQYIGAIVVGMLAFQGATQFVGIVAFTLSRMANGPRHSVLEPAPAFPWDSVVNQLMNAALQFGAAYLLYKWARLGRRLEPEPVVAADGVLSGEAEAEAGSGERPDGEEEKPRD
jgi:hypothetical protein